MPGLGVEIASPRTPLRREVGSLYNSEVWWRDRYHDIEARGYELRSRYHPNWQPSWKELGQDFFNAEDGQATISRATMNAVRIEDGRPVMLKKVLPAEGPHELLITQLFSSPGLKRHPKNHCVPLLDLVDLSHIRPDGRKLMVMPLLRPFKNPSFQTYGEFVAFFMQICEGLQFMHERNVAHRDCTVNNIMFDPSGMFPEGYHPVQLDRRPNFKGRAKRYSRTERPPRYYLIDFGLSRRYSSRNVMDAPLRGGDRSAPEHQRGWRCNPFQTDIYYLGNLIRDTFMNKYNGFEFMSGLVNAMTNESPAMRPRIEEVIEKFDGIRRSLSIIKLRSPITSKKDHALFTVYRHVRQLTRTFGHVIHRRPAIPVPS